MVYCCNYLVLLLLCQWEVTDSLIAVLLKIMHFAWYIQPPDIWQHQALHKVKNIIWMLLHLVTVFIFLSISHHIMHAHIWTHYPAIHYYPAVLYIANHL